VTTSMAHTVRLLIINFGIALTPFPIKLN